LCWWSSATAPHDAIVKVVGHRFAAGRIRPVCEPVAGSFMRFQGKRQTVRSDRGYSDL